MRRLALAAFLPTLLLLLGSCSRIFLVEAVFVGGKLTFVSDDDEETFRPWCWNQFQIFDDSGRELWAFDAYEAYRDSESCGPNFPLTYGRAPAGAKVTRPAAGLSPGPLYVISGSAAGSLTGAFTFSRVDGRTYVDNVDPHSPEVRAAESRFREGRGGSPPAGEAEAIAH